MQIVWRVRPGLSAIIPFSDSALFDAKLRKPPPAAHAVSCPILFHFDGSQDWVIA